MPSLYRTVVQPIVTEKSSAAYEERRIYTFRVDPAATKPAIRDAIEQLFGVTVTRVRTMRIPAKARRLAGREGRESRWKKAIVTLKEGDVIPVFEG